MNHHNVEPRMIADAIAETGLADRHGRRWYPSWEFPGVIEWQSDDTEMAFYATPGWGGEPTVVCFELREADGCSAEARDVDCGAMIPETYLAAVRFYLATSAILGES